MAEDRDLQWDYGVQRGGSLRYGPPFNSHFLYNDSVGERGGLLDTIDNRQGNNPFSLVRYVENYPLLNGEWPGGGAPFFIKYEECPIGASVLGAEDPRSQFPQLDLAELNELAWTILARTNPSRPHVGVPAALGELRDLPSLVKGWGQGYLKGLAKANLSWKFGLAPMLGDIQKLFDFTTAVNKRLKYLRRLRDGKVLRTRCRLGTTEIVVDHGNELIHSNGSLIYANSSTTHTSEMWGTAEWKLLDTSSLPDMDDAEMKVFAQALAAGVTSYGALEAAWELTPWSWFVDWFSNVGEVLSASNNAVGCTWGRICVMRHSRSVKTYDKDSVSAEDWINFNGWFTLIGERKERYPTYPVIPVPLPRLPIIDGGKFSILLSLAALRR